MSCWLDTYIVALGQCLLVISNHFWLIEEKRQIIIYKVGFTYVSVVLSKCQISCHEILWGDEVFAPWPWRMKFCTYLMVKSRSTLVHSYPTIIFFHANTICIASSRFNLIIHSKQDVLPVRTKLNFKFWLTCYIANELGFKWRKTVSYHSVLNSSKNLYLCMCIYMYFCYYSNRFIHISYRIVNQRLLLFSKSIYTIIWYKKHFLTRYLDQIWNILTTNSWNII